MTEQIQKVMLADKKHFPIGLGTWHMGDDRNKRPLELEALRTGIEKGATIIDTAEMYGEGNAEKLVGEAIQPFDRGSLFLISKIYPWNASLRALPQHLDKSLERLGTDYLDLYLLHWTGEIPLAETVAAMEDAKKAGKIRHWGVSNFDVSDMEELWQIPDGKSCATNEVLYNLGSRGIDFDLLPWMREKQLPLIAYSPIAQGDSLGNDFTKNPVLKEIARAHDCSIFQVLLAWTLRGGDTIAIPQSSNKKHVLDNIAAASLTLTNEEWQAIETAFPKPDHKQPLAVL